MGKRVLTAGTFDLIHAGHLRLFMEARRLAGLDGELIVVVARDENVVKFKGRPPVLPEEDRLLIIQNLRPVDEAILGDREDLLNSIVREGPDLIVLGYDQWAEEEWLKTELASRDVHVDIVRMTKFDVRVPSTREVIEKVINMYRNDRREDAGRSPEPDS